MASHRFPSSTNYKKTKSAVSASFPPNNQISQARKVKHKTKEDMQPTPPLASPSCGIGETVPLLHLKRNKKKRKRKKKLKCAA